MAAAFTRAGLRRGRRPHDRSDRGPRRPRATAAARSRAAASRSATCSAPAAAGRRRSATTRARSAAIRRFVDRARHVRARRVQRLPDGRRPRARARPGDARRRGRASCSNRSERFEARARPARASRHSPSLFFRGMAGSRIPIANAHGEGRAEFATPTQLAALEAQRPRRARASSTVAATSPSAIRRTPTARRTASPRSRRPTAASR